jgi:nickel/cobalt transporter (NicO) family protein
VNATTPALIAAAAGVGFGHAIMPDHWVPLSVVGRTRRYPLTRVARLSGLAGVAHVLVSLVLGVVIVAIGLQFRSTVEHAQDTIVGAVLIATGLGFLALELVGHGHDHTHDHRHGHHPHGPGHDHAAPGQSQRARDGHGHPAHDEHAHAGPRGHLRGVAGIMVPFGAAASPDLTILPVFLAAAAVGAGTAVSSLIAFALVTITTIVVLTLLATAGGYRVRGAWLDRWGNAITAVVLLAIGTLVVAGAI